MLPIVKPTIAITITFIQRITSNYPYNYQDLSSISFGSLAQSTFVCFLVESLAMILFALWAIDVVLLIFYQEFYT